MLSQRVLKACEQLALGAMPERASAILASLMDELRTTNTALPGHPKGPLAHELRAQAARVNKLAAVVALPPCVYAGTAGVEPVTGAGDDSGRRRAVDTSSIW